MIGGNCEKAHSKVQANGRLFSEKITRRNSVDFVQAWKKFPYKNMSVGFFQLWKKNLFGYDISGIGRFPDRICD